MGKFFRKVREQIWTPELRLCKYYFATRRSMTEQQYLTASLDFARVGRRQVGVGVVANTENVAAWAVPQVVTPQFRMFQCRAKQNCASPLL